MTRVLVTGFNARTASPRRAQRDTCFAALLTAALRDNGIDVDHRDTRVGEHVEDDYDHVFVGVASPLAVSSNRTYTALSAIGRMWGSDRLTLFLDDPDIGKIPHGLASLARKPEQFTKPFFATRTDFAVADTPQWRSWLLEVALALRTEWWPRVLVPAFPWADRLRLMASLPVHMQHKAALLDLSSYQDVNLYVTNAPREKYWFTEESFKSPWVRGLGLDSPINNLTRCTDRSRSIEYSHAWGVLEDASGALMHGWYRPRLLIAAWAGALYTTRWQSMTAVGPMYTVLPHEMDQFTPAHRDEVAAQQRERLATLTWTQDDARERVGALVARPTAAGGVA